jgi:hypothetical protein
VLNNQDTWRASSNISDQIQIWQTKEQFDKQKPIQTIKIHTIIDGSRCSAQLCITSNNLAAPWNR